MATIVLVPGSFAPAALYADFVEVLKKAGLDTIVVDTPSVGRREGKGPATMTDDANEISKVVLPLVDQGKEVVLVAHSYGGIPTTQSLETLSQKARSAQGKSGGVRKVVYLTAVVLQAGMSNFELFGGAMPDFVSVNVSISKVRFSTRNFPGLSRSCSFVADDNPGRLHESLGRGQRSLDILRSTGRRGSEMGEPHVCAFDTELQGEAELSRLQ